MIRNTLFLPLMAAAIGGPFLFLSDSDDGSEEADSTIEEKTMELEAVRLDDQPPQSFYEPQENLDEVFSFNWTPNQLASRWPKMTQTRLNGFRVCRTSLLSGHGDTDIVGAVTYRFDSRDRLKSVRFTGFAVDPARLVQLAQGRFGFSPSDSERTRFLPSTFAGYSGSLTMSRSLKYEGQWKLDFEVSR